MVFFKRSRVPATTEILREMLRELHYLQRGTRHIYGLSNSLEPFVEKFPKLEKVTDAQIVEYLDALSPKAGPRRRDNILCTITQLSRFARRRNYLPEDCRSAAEKVRRIKPGHDVVTWTIDEAKLLLEHVSEKWRPFTVLGLFAGLRSSEILRLHWSDFDFSEQVILISRKVARKTRTSRAVPIHENLFAWLQPYRDRVGPLYPGSFKTNENARCAETSRIRRSTGLPRKDNANRHSFGSYRLAITKSCDQVAHEMGNSPRMVRESYNHPKSEAKGREYFALRPPEFENVIPMNLPLEFRQ